MRQSGLTSLAAVASIASGLLLDVAIAAAFGAGREADAFFVAARLPLGLVAIVMVVANQALVPTISTWSVQRDDRTSTALVSHTLTAALLVASAAGAIGGLLALPLMRAIAPGLSAAQVQLAASTSRVMFLVVPLVTAAEVLRALLNARYSFVAPAAMHVVMNGVAATLVVAFAGTAVQLLAWAYVAGAFAQLAFMAVMAHRRGFRYRPGFGLRNAEILAAARLSLRPTVAAGLNPLARVGEQAIVSFLPPGSISILNYGYRLISAIGGSVFFRSVVVALLPRLTEATARGDDEDVARLAALGVRIMLVLSIPLTALLAVLARPMVLVLFRRGSFTRDDAAVLGLVLAVYAASLVGSGVQRALLSPFFARLDTRTPLRNTFYGVAANLILLPALVLPFRDTAERAVVGVAAAYSLAQYVNVVHAWGRLRRVVAVPLPGLPTLTARLVMAAGGAAAAMVWTEHALHLEDRPTPAALLLRASAVGTVGVVTLSVLMAAVSRRDVRHIMGAVRARSGPPPSPPD